MSAHQQETHAVNRPRPRANTSFSALPFIRSRTEAPALASSPAAPVETLPLDSLIDALTPPAVPSMSHVRSLVSALAHQTPSPAPSTLMPILATLCSPDSPPALQAGGFEVMLAYCACGVQLSTSFRLSFFELVRTSNTWTTEVWEPRSKALVGLFPSADDVMGVDSALLSVVSAWVDKAVEELLACGTASAAEIKEKKKVVEVLNKSLLDWFDKVDRSGRLTDEDVSTLFEFYRTIVERAISTPPEKWRSASDTVPATPSSQSPTPMRNHRKQASSASILTSALSTLTAHQQQQQQHQNIPTVSQPAHFVTFLYLSFLQSRLLRLPPAYLRRILPLLFRILATYMSPLPVISLLANILKPTSDQQDIDQKVSKIISALLDGPYSTAGLILLKRCLCPLSGKTDSDTSVQVKISLGAHRTLRLQIRQILEDRLAALYISRGASDMSTPAGAPSQVSFNQYIEDRANRAWKRDIGGGGRAASWDARKVGGVLVKAIEEWVAWTPSEGGVVGVGVDAALVLEGRERIFEEIAGLLKDVLFEMDERGSDAGQDFHDDTPAVVGEVLCALVGVVKTMRTTDGSPVVLPLGNALAGTTPLLRLLADLLGRDFSHTRLAPPLPVVWLSVAEHLTDVDTQKIPVMMSEGNMLTPVAGAWLDSWDSLLRTECLYDYNRPLTRAAVVSTLQEVFSLVSDMRRYRRPLAGRIFEFWTRLVEQDREGSHSAVMWGMLGEEVILRSSEDNIEELFTPVEELEKEVSREGGEEVPRADLDVTIQKILRAMVDVAGTCSCPDDDVPTPALTGGEETPLSPHAPLTPANTLVGTGTGALSPVLSRAATESPVSASASVSPKERERERELQPQGQTLLSLSLFNFGGSTRHRSQTSLSQQTTKEDSSPTRATLADLSPAPLGVTVCRSVSAVTALVDVFTQLAFTRSRMTARQARLAIYVYERLLALLRTAKCVRTRLVVLQVLMRLRADRDHRVFMMGTPGERQPQVLALAALIDRAADVGGRAPSNTNEDARAEEISAEEPRRARPRTILVERDGRRATRGGGRGSRTSESTLSRSRSRAAARHKTVPSTLAAQKLRVPLWMAPDVPPFSVECAERQSQLVITYDPSKKQIDAAVLPVSSYLDVLAEILKTEREWDVLSYVLVHLPVQLANKHFWCGPRARESIVRFVSELCKAISEATIGKFVPAEDWPPNQKQRDALSLAYHTLTVLISYATTFDQNRRQVLVEVLQAGLSGMPSTVKCCLHAMTLCAFEMPSTMIRVLPRVLEKLAQIMDNPSMAVHILTFLAMVASIPSLYANFNEDHFRMVFGVALQYLTHHNRPETMAELSFALSQHLRVLCYDVVYLWFLALKLADRPTHIKFISRQLLLANQGRPEVDAPTEVCFDWLARYTYASADPKPAPSLLGDVLSNPSPEELPEPASQVQKAWIVGHSIVTVKTLAKPGWIEVTTRRASGTTKFLCRNENVPLVGPGDPDPDLVTVPVVLMMDKDPRAVGVVPARLQGPPPLESLEGLTDVDGHVFAPASTEGDLERPDAITGYVWSGSAPSQRRKVVDLDPSYIRLQLSPFPDIRQDTTRARLITDKNALGALIRTLDRTPVIDTHKVGILYVAPGQTKESDILRNTHGSPAYTRFLAGIGRLISLRGQVDVYCGGLDPDEDGEYAYAWWDDIGQILYHAATLMPNQPHDEQGNFKKRHIGNDYVRIVWNDSGLPYKFDTLSTEFQFVNIVIEPHSLGAIAAYSNSVHENEYFRLTIQRAAGMVEFSPVGEYKIVSAASLSPLVRQLSLIADWYASIFQHTARDTDKAEFITNWRSRLEAIKRFAANIPKPVEPPSPDAGIMGQESYRDFTSNY